MKRLSPADRCRHIRYCRRLHRRRARHRLQRDYRPPAARLISAAEQADIEFKRVSKGLPEPPIRLESFERPGIPKRKAIYLSAPQAMSLSAARADLLGFIYHYRRMSFRPDAQFAKRKAKTMVADLSAVLRLDLDAALMLTAEYHRMCILTPGGHRPWIADEDWPPSIRSIFKSLGLYGLVDAPLHEDDEEDPELEIRLVPFISRDNVDGEFAAQLIGDLTAVAGDTPARKKVYGGLMEAMKNAINHAYPDDAPKRIDRTISRWWAAGAYRPAERVLQFAVYDQGVGIPWTLPRNTSRWKALVSNTPVERTDADVIAGAIEFGRSSTELEGRGNGLATICDVIAGLEGSFVRIISGSGAVTYFDRHRALKENFDNPFCGTLVEWTLKLPPEEDVREAA